MYNLNIKEIARKELDNISDPFFTKIDEVILSLRENPCPRKKSKKVKKINGDIYKISTGEMEILYTINEKQKAVIIYSIQYSDDIYK
ncbi:MAG: hypothetical protein E3K32_11105 [wastewater metagenome]|nr:hypothetical protein [Candidatus Loosdrechtia aerotolerans]